MKKKLRGNHAAIIVLFIFLCLLIFVKCVNEENDNIRQKEVDSIVVANQLSAKKTSYQEFAGSESCRNCHGAISKTHIHTSHHLTTQPAVEKNIKGKFQNGKNKYYYNPALMVAMEKRDSALYQVV